jgi:hypothetical protein
MTAPRLIDTRQEIVEETSGQHIAAYRAMVRGCGAPLTVSLPARLTPVQALEIVDQLRELVAAVVGGANELAWERPAREELTRNIEYLQAAHTAVTTLEKAQDLLHFYSHFRDAVAEYLRAAPHSR